jgi:GAF domain-containing protein
LPVLSASHGDPSLELGEVVPRRDPALCLAREGEPAVLLPDSSLAARAIALRLCPDRSPRGLAVIPIRAATELAGVVELARFDHPFRASEVRSMVPLMAATVARLEELAWES